MQYYSYVLKCNTVDSQCSTLHERTFTIMLLLLFSTWRAEIWIPLFNSYPAQLNRLHAPSTNLTNDDLRVHSSLRNPPIILTLAMLEWIIELRQLLYLWHPHKLIQGTSLAWTEVHPNLHNCLSNNAMVR